MNPPATPEQIIEICRLAWQRGYMAAGDGNLSARLDSERILITPRGRSKALLEPGDLVQVDLASGQAQAPELASRELGLHLMAYEQRPQAGAVLHAHPPMATALGLAGRGLEEVALPQLLGRVGQVPLVPYAPPASPELVRAVEPFLARHDVVILERHGTLALGADLEQAWELTELVEQAAQVMVAAQALGGVQAPAAQGPRPLDQRFELVHLPVTDQFAVQKRHYDQRGQAHLIVDDLPLRRVCFLTLLPGSGHRGGHYHLAKHEGFYLVDGRARVELACAESGQRQVLELVPGDRLWLEPGVAHRITALEPVSFVEFTDRPYQAQDDRPYDFGQ